MTTSDVSFDLWHQPWIRVIDQEGSDAELSIGDCLRRAHTLAGLSDPSPLVVGGTHRLLAAILQAIYAPQDLGQIADLLRSGQFDEERLAQFAAEHADRFDIFHPTTPFLQTGDVPLDGWKKPGKGKKHAWSDAKAAAALFVEVPSATKRTLFHHVTDDSNYLCPACCARGLVSIPAFASSEGAGVRPSINGVPPIYVLPVGASFFETLTLSMIVPGYQPSTADPDRQDLAIWNGTTTIAKSEQVSSIGYVESLTFPARRMRLYPQHMHTLCTHCGSHTSVIVSQLLYDMGRWVSAGVGVWEDPFAAFRKPKGRNKNADADPKPVRPEEGKALWREYNSLLLANDDQQFRPRVVQQIASLISRAKLDETQSIRFRCLGIRTDGKAKIFEWLDEALETPPTLLTDIDGASYVEEALARSDEIRFIIESHFNRHFRPQRDQSRGDKLPRFKTLRSRMLADYWQRLAPHFRRFVFDLTDANTRDQIEQGWIDTLVQTGRDCFDLAASQIGEQADALRARVEALDKCHHRLNTKRKEWLNEYA